MFKKREEPEKKLSEVQRSTLGLVRMERQRLRVDMSRAEGGQVKDKNWAHMYSVFNHVT
jgi:hypothetical protein